MTRREEIIEILKAEAVSAQELANYFRCIVKEIEDDLRHIAKSVRPDYELKMYPAVCRSCGFVFRERSRIKKPSKCPKCRSESIEFPKFRIEESLAKKKSAGK
jgi:hypothetical protein